MSNLQSFDMFLSVVAIMFVIWTFAQIWAHLTDEILWWATPTSWKVVIKTAEWKIEVLGAHYAVWKFNSLNHISRRWSNWFTMWLRAGAEADMRIAIGHAESRLETLSLLLNEIQQ